MCRKVAPCHGQLPLSGRHWFHLFLLYPPSLPHKYIYMDMEINKIHVCVMASQAYKIHTFNFKKIDVKFPQRICKTKTVHTMHSTWFHLQMRLLKSGCNQNDCIHVMWRAQKPFILATPVAGSTTDGNMLHFSYSTRCSCSSINVNGSPCACVAILCTTKKNIFDQFN